MENRYTDGTYLANNPTWHAESSILKANDILKMLKKNNLAPKTICEVGCGAGHILNHLYEQMGEDVEFSGYEISPQAFEMCQQHKKDRLNYYLKNMLEEEVFFDLVLCMDVVEHIENPFEFLRRIHSRGKYKIFQIPLDLSVQSILTGGVAANRELVGHIHYFTKELAFALLQETGFKVIDSFHVIDHLYEKGGSLFRRALHTFERMIYSLRPNLAVKLFDGFSILFLTE